MSDQTAAQCVGQGFDHTTYECCGAGIWNDATNGNCCKAGEGLDIYGDCCDMSNPVSGFGCCTPDDWKKEPVLCQYAQPCDYKADAPATMCCVTDQNCILNACNNDFTCAKKAVNKYCTYIGQYTGSGTCCDPNQPASSGIDADGYCCDLQNPTYLGCCTPTDWENNAPQCVITPPKKS